jgi:zinc protease
MVVAPALEEARVIVVDRPGAAQTELRVGHVGVPRGHSDRAGLGFLNAILGGKFTSRINLNLRERLGITYGAHSRFVDRRSAGPFVVSCALSNEAVGLGAREILGELTRLREEPIADREIEETRSYLLGVFPYGLQTVEGLAARLRDIAIHDLPLDHTERVIDTYRAIDGTELTRLARAHLAPRSSLVVAAGPADVIAPQLEAIAPPRIVPARSREAPPGP